MRNKGSGILHQGRTTLFCPMTIKKLCSVIIGKFRRVLQRRRIVLSKRRMTSRWCRAIPQRGGLFRTIQRYSGCYPELINITLSGYEIPGPVGGRRPLCLPSFIIHDKSPGAHTGAPLQTSSGEHPEHATHSCRFHQVRGI